MFELIIGIIVGATFAEFWRHIYRLAKRKISHWMEESKTSSESDR